MTQEQRGIYHLFFWGGVENDGLASSHFGEQRNYWFHSLLERKNFKEKVEKFAKEHDQRVVFDENEGQHSWKRPVACMEMIYNGKVYPFEYKFQYGYSADTANYCFTEGSYACDCNRSMMLLEKYPDIPELDCGDTITLNNFRVEFRD